MSKQKLCLLLINILFVSYSFSQSQRNPEQIVSDLLESTSQNSELIGPNNQAFEDLLDIIHNPIQINSASKEDLDQLIFLSPLQVQNLFDFTQNQGSIKSIYQLQGVKDMPIETLKVLQNFIRFEEEGSQYSSKKYFKGQLIMRDMFDLDNASAYGNDSIASKYLGDKHHLYSRLQLQYGANWYAGITLDKDPGEGIFKSHPNYIDFYSGHVLYSGKKWLKTFIIGDYSANIGQGLALWTSTAMGKSAEPLNINKRGKTIAKYTSANEYSFFRGAAATFSISDLELTIFSNYKNRDANIELDPDSNKIINSMPETGYHRTDSELSKRNNLLQKTIGANVNYYYRALNIGIGGYYNEFDADTIIQNNAYKLFTTPKVKMSNYWLNYKYSVNKLLLFGEVASTSEYNVALSNGLIFSPQNNISLSLLHRHISKKYYSLYTNSFGEYSTPAGESGIYLGMVTYPFKNIELSGYFDFFKSEWLEYQTSAPSNGYDYMVNINYQFARQFSIYVRYKEKEKAKNNRIDGNPTFTIHNTNQKKIRLHATYNSSEVSRIQFRFENSFYENNDVSSGYLSYIDYKHSWIEDKISLWLRYTVFDTDDYYSRIYTYENDLLYNFYTPAFQNEGTRFYTQLRWKVIPPLRIWLKYSKTWYSHKNEIGSGDNTIEGNSRTNLKIQLQYIF
ncbi:ComEA family DNA-binding protein [Saccharicrinis aurantiacus]|uniref:ComEA family DNA-binding protein n=1 Tax=Saccharicrinis aurantiacus TaxID=1849719 RepID=UPI0009502C26|nr:helix-hairpin-helix domain-containing protein [Saccharicrinis aurantiacus]